MILLTLSLVGLSNYVSADDALLPQNLLITEVQTGSESSASQEFVEVYNPRDDSVNLTGWRLEYASATSLNWNTKVELSGTIQPRGFYTVSTADYVVGASDDVLSSGLAASGGHLRLVEQLSSDGDGADEPSSQEQIAVHDLIGWGSALHAEVLPAPSQTGGESLKRIVDEDGEFVDTNDNSLDWFVSIQPQPMQTLAPVEEESGDDQNDDQEDEQNQDPLVGNGQGGSEPVIYSAVEITEILPDPVSPKTDADDEYIELYNPHSRPVSLSGYVIQSGSNLQYSFTIGEVVLPAGSYRAFYAHETNLTFANSGSRAQVLAPDGSVAGQMVRYTDSTPGESWSKFAGGFSWTDVQTPSSANKPRRLASSSKATTATTTKVAASTTQSYPKLMITEVFPDPASPLKDANDEFVELYNPNSFAVSLLDWKIKSGSTLRSSCKLPPQDIGAKKYLAFFSSDCTLSLGNKGGSVELHNPNKQVAATIEAYPKAISGSTWALIDGKWQWTSKPTPAAKNELVASSSTDGTGNSSSNSLGGGISTDPKQVFSQAASIPTHTVDYQAVAIVGTGALLYSLYEWKADIRNLYRRSRGYLSSWGADR